MISKALTGFAALDERYGGIYAGRVALLSGAAGSGKTLFGLQFLAQGVQHGERGVLLSTHPLDDVMRMAEALRLPLVKHVAAERILLLEYSLPPPGSGSGEEATLPPDGFLQLSEMIQEQAVRRVVLDTVVPWVALPGLDRPSEHVLSFVRACDRMGTTTLFTLPRPRSPAAMRLRGWIEDIVPVSLSLEPAIPGSEQRLVVHKYLGMAIKEGPIPYAVIPGKGLAGGRDPVAAGAPDGAGGTPGFADIMKHKSLILSR